MGRNGATPPQRQASNRGFEVEQCAVNGGAGGDWSDERGESERMEGGTGLAVRQGGTDRS